MARTKASVGSKVSSGKSSKARCCAAPAPSTSGSGSSDKASRGTTSGGNPVCHRETPKWQRPITNFFIHKDGERKECENIENGDLEAESSKSDQSENVVAAKNSVLDESIELQPLNGEASHKIEEYYSKGSKGKGIGKKTKGKENRKDNKRSRDEEEESVSKRVRVEED